MTTMKKAPQTITITAITHVRVINQSIPSAQLVTAQDYFLQGDYEYDQGNCSQAITDYTQAIHLNSQDAQVYNNQPRIPTHAFSVGI